MAPPLYLLRHGETLWNREHRIQGWQDSPLTERGVRQARAMGRRLADLLPDPTVATLYTSPQGRAVASADLVVSAFSRPFADRIVDPDLRERRFGTWEGRSHAELEVEAPGWRNALAEAGWTAAAPGGESLAHLSQRVDRWWRTVPRDRVVVVVAHGQVSRVFRALLLGLGPDAALALPSAAQDAFFRFGDGALETIATMRHEAETFEEAMPDRG